MSKRYVDDSYWTDPYIEKLDPSEKLLFLYFLTNPLCNIAGIYEIRNSRVAYETGFDKEMVERIKNRFVKDKKMLVIGDWVVMLNFVKNQVSNPSVLAGVQRILNELPPKIIEKLTGCIQSGGSLSYFTLLNLTLPNLTKPEQGQSEATTKVEEVNINKQIGEVIKAMADKIDKKNCKFYGHAVQRDACKFLIESYGYENVLGFINSISENMHKVFNPPTTPKMLMDNWVRIVAGAGFEKYKQIKNQPNLII